MRYISGRDNLSCTVFVPWDCRNHCRFCTTKAMYGQRECDMDAIRAQIYVVNNNPAIREFVFTGGEPLADIGQLQLLLDATDKPVFVNTTFPTNGNADKLIKFVNGSKIAGINISRHMDQAFCESVLPYSEFKRIKKPIRLNVVLSGEFNIDAFMEFIAPLRGLCKNMVICLRADYRKVTKETLKNRDPVFDALMEQFEYAGSSGCMVCNDDRFYDDDLVVSYHRGLEHSLVVYGDKRYVNDVLVTMDGMVYPDWDMAEDSEFEAWLLGDTCIDDVADKNVERILTAWDKETRSEGNTEWMEPDSPKLVQAKLPNGEVVDINNAKVLKQENSERLDVLKTGMRGYFKNIVKEPRYTIPDSSCYSGGCGGYHMREGCGYPYGRGCGGSSYSGGCGGFIGGC